MKFSSRPYSIHCCHLRRAYLVVILLGFGCYTIAFGQTANENSASVPPKQITTGIVKLGSARLGQTISNHRPDQMIGGQLSYEKPLGKHWSIQTGFWLGYRFGDGEAQNVGLQIGPRYYLNVGKTNQKGTLLAQLTGSYLGFDLGIQRSDLLRYPKRGTYSYSWFSTAFFIGKQFQLSPRWVLDANIGPALFANYDHLNIDRIKGDFAMTGQFALGYRFAYAHDPQIDDTRSPVLETSLWKLNIREFSFSQNSYDLPNEGIQVQLSYELKPSLSWSTQFGVSLGRSTFKNFHIQYAELFSGIHFSARNYYRQKANLRKGKQSHNLAGSYFSGGIEYLYSRRLHKELTDWDHNRYAALISIRWGRQFNLGQSWFLDFNYGAGFKAISRDYIRPTKEWYLSVLPASDLAIGYRF